MRLAHVEAAILTGGMERHGAPLLAGVVAALSKCVERVRLVTRWGEPAPLELECIEDHYRERAPIVGLHAALAACESGAVLVAACDLPQIDPRLVLALLALVADEDSHEIVAPLGAGGPQPLLAVYRPILVPEIARRIEARELALTSLLRHAQTLLVPAAALRSIDPSSELGDGP